MITPPGEKRARWPKRGQPFLRDLGNFHCRKLAKGGAP